MTDLIPDRLYIWGCNVLVKLFSTATRFMYWIIGE